MTMTETSKLNESHPSSDEILKKSVVLKYLRRIFEAERTKTVLKYNEDFHNFCLPASWQFHSQSQVGGRYSALLIPLPHHH